MQHRYKNHEQCQRDVLGNIFDFAYAVVNFIKKHAANVGTIHFVAVRANMPCAAHAVFVASCHGCRADRSVNTAVLSLGPRTPAQFESLMNAAACTTTPATIVALPDGTVGHKVHELAMHIAQSTAGSIAVRDLPASPATQELLLKRLPRDPFVSSRVALVSATAVRAQTPLCMHNAATLVARVRDNCCKGTRLTDIVAEYSEAYVHANDAVEDGTFFTDQICVWHADAVHAAVPGALEAWTAMK